MPPTTPEVNEPPPPRGPALLRRIVESWNDPARRPAVLGAAVAAGLLALIYWRNLVHFGMSWTTDENYSHGFLVPLISLYFADLAARRGPTKPGGGVAIGLALVVAASLVKLGTAVIVVGTLGDLALVTTIAGVCALLAGAEALRRYGFAIGFLLFMIPMPVALYATIASPLQLMVSQFASVLLNASGVPVLTEGNMMTLPGGVQMFVAEACSGMRQLTGFLALTAAVAYLTDRPAWYRGAVIAAAVPVALTANVARVTLTGYIMYFVNPAYASGTFHTVEGLLLLGFGLALLRGLCAALDAAIEITSPAAEPGPANAAVRAEASQAMSGPHGGAALEIDDPIPVRGLAAPAGGGAR
jgi:exosortase